MHLPECALLGGGLGCLGRLLRARVDVVQRQMPPDVGDLAVLAQQFAQHRLRLAAVRTLEIAILEHGDRRVEPAADVVALGVDRIREVDDEVRCAQQRADPLPPRQPLRHEDEEPGDRGGEQRRAEDSDFRLVELGSVEREIGDEDRDGETDSRDRARAGHRRPADRGPQAPAADLRREPGSTDDPHRLPDHVAEQDPERNGRRVRRRKEAGAEVDAGVREREERHDRVARPGMPERLQSLVRGDRRPQRGPCGTRQAACGLLPEEAEDVARASEVAPLGRVGERDHAAHEARDDRVHAGLVERDPDRRAEHEVDGAEVDVRGADEQDAGEQPERDEERDDGDRPAVDDRDHEQRDDVVDHRDRQEIRTQAVREARAHEGEQPERECGVRRHRRSPAVDRVVARVDRQIDPHGHDHPGEPGQKRQCHAPPFAQLAEVELAPRLQPHHEEEERHQAAVDPTPQVLPQLPVPEPHGKAGTPDRLVRRRVDVRPHQGRDGRAEQHGGAAGLGAQEGAQRGFGAVYPGGPSGPPGAVGRLGHVSPRARSAGAGPGSGCRRARRPG